MYEDSIECHIPSSTRILKIARYNHDTWIIQGLYNSNVLISSTVVWKEVEVSDKMVAALRYMSVNAWCEKLYKLAALKEELDDHKKLMSDLSTRFNRM